MKTEAYHIPVMLSECLDALSIQPKGVYVDVTFGGGGHSQAMLEQLGPDGRLFAFDQDPDALNNQLDDDRFKLIHQNFQFMKNHLRLHGVKEVDGILADLGVSSHQFDDAARGFSIRFDSQLDMRMDQARDLDARKVINAYTEEELHRIFGMYGELRNAKTLARTIVAARAKNEIETVGELKQVIESLIPRQKSNQYLAQVFQAIRIEVNGEMDALKNMLTQSAEILKPGGRLVVMSYHSLEDRLVKNFMMKGKFSGPVEKDFYGNELKPFQALNRRPILANDDEISKNGRARSAKLRIAEKL